MNSKKQYIKEFEVEYRLRNNLLKQRRTELGFTSQTSFAKAVGIPTTCYNALETMRSSPIGRTGEWTPTAVKLAEFHGLSCEELWPDSVLAVTKSTTVRRLSAQEIGYALLGENSAQEVTPYELVANNEEHAIVRKASKCLTEQEVHFVQMDMADTTLDRIGSSFNLSRERVRQVLVGAHSKLRRKYVQIAADYRTDRLDQIEWPVPLSDCTYPDIDKRFEDIVSADAWKLACSALGKCFPRCAQHVFDHTEFQKRVVRLDRFVGLLKDTIQIDTWMSKIKWRGGLVAVIFFGAEWRAHYEKTHPKHHGRVYVSHSLEKFRDPKVCYSTWTAEECLKAKRLPPEDCPRCALLNSPPVTTRTCPKCKGLGANAKFSFGTREPLPQQDCAYCGNMGYVYSK